MSESFQPLLLLGKSGSNFLANFQLLLQPRVLSVIALGVLQLLLVFLLRHLPDTSIKNKDAIETDPGLLKKHSEFRSYHVPATGFTYPSIRTFYRQHSQADKLPSKPLPIPLLVFIHGLGGSAAQFGPLLNSLSNVGTCLAIDLPGCGLSDSSPRNWNAYTTQALAKLIAVIVDSYRDKQNSQGVVFIGHSMGSSLAAILSSPLSNDIGDLTKRVAGLIAICPRAHPPTPQQATSVRRFLLLPGIFLSILRYFDRRGGTESSSVKRMVGPNAETETKQLQLRFNKQSDTDVFRRMTSGLLPKFRKGKQVDGLPPEQFWSSLDLPLFLISGESDRVTAPEEAEKISSLVQLAWNENPRDSSFGWIQLHDMERETDSGTAVSKLRPPRALKISILPAPASHSLFFAPTTCRTISGLIQSFLAEHIDERLSLGWQLQHLSTEGKWDVKNLAKWQAVEPVSEPVGGLFRAMKTMREVDESHCPKEFAKKWAGDIQAVVDISHENPVYDPSGLKGGGIEYQKFPTVSKLPPTEQECKDFNDLVDKLRASATPKSDGSLPLIAVHCHYGFNRTGMFIVCYLVDRMGWRLQDAIEEFSIKRPPGIKHSYFIDTLFVRYTVGMKKAPTW